MIRFTRDGRHVILRDGDVLGVVELEGTGAEKSIRAAGLRDFAAFDDEIWVVAGDPPILSRYSVAGEARGSETRLGAAGAIGSLLGVPFGDPAALWLGADRIDLRLENGQVQALPINPVGDGGERSASEVAMVPLSVGRRIELANGRLTLCGPDGVQALGPAGGDEGMRLVDGAALFDEKAAALLFAQGGVQMLIVVALPEGTIRHRLSFAGVERACFAPRRGHVVLLTGERKLSIVDLRFGKILKTWEEPQRVLDLAVDAGARHLVLQREVPGAEPETFYGSYRDILGAVVSAGRAAAAPRPRAPALKVADPPPPDDESDGEEPSEADAAKVAGTADPKGVGAGESSADPKGVGAGESSADPKGDAGASKDVTKAGAGTADVPSVGDAARAAAARFSSRSALSGSSSSSPSSPSSPTVGRRPPARATSPLATARPGGTRPVSGTAAAPSRTGAPRSAPASAEAPSDPAAATGDDVARPTPPLRASSPAGTRPGLAAALRSAPSAPLRPPLRAPSSPPRPLPVELRPSSPNLAMRRSASGPPVENTPRRPPSDVAPPPLGSIDEDLREVVNWCERLLGEARAAGLSLSIAEADTLVDRARNAPTTQAEDGDATPRGTLAREFGLSPIDADVLLVVAAPSLRGDVGRLYAALSPARPGCDELLVGQLLGEDRRPAIARALDDDAPLLRAGLIRRAAGARPFAPLEIDPIIRRRLRGEQRPGLDGEAHFTVLEPQLSFDDLVLAEGTASALRDAFERLLDDVSPPVRLLLRAARGRGRRTALSSLAVAAGRAIALVDVGAGGEAIDGAIGESGSELGRTLRRAALAGSIPCLTGLDGIVGDAKLGAEVRAVLSRHAGPVALRCPPRTPPHLVAAGDNVIVVDLPPVAEAERVLLWRRALAARELPIEAAEPLAARHLGAAGSIAPVVDAVAEEAGSTEPSVLLARIEAALMRNRDRLFSGIATRVRDAVSPPQVAYPPSVEDGLSTLSARASEKWGSAQLHGGAGTVACFSGARGTGKSTAAALLASELGQALYRVDARALARAKEGEAARAFGILAEASSEGPLLLLFEQADALLSSEKPAVQAALDHFVSDFGGVAIFEVAGALHDDRFQLRIDFPAPDEEVRERLFRIHLPASAGGLDVTRLAALRPLCGAQIRDTVRNALLLASREGVPLSEEHLERALEFSPA